MCVAGLGNVLLSAGALTGRAAGTSVSAICTALYGQGGALGCARAWAWQRAGGLVCFSPLPLHHAVACYPTIPRTPLAAYPHRHLHVCSLHLGQLPKHPLPLYLRFP